MTSTMETKKKENIRRNGKYYTPELLAEFLAKPLIRDTTKSVFDPAYGDGALLLAAEKVSQVRGVYPSVRLYGCDKAPVNGLLHRIPTSQLIKENFFRYIPTKKFDVILMNPPYVRHHLMSENEWSLYQKTTNGILQLNSYSDLWAYFLIKATLHLKKFGSIGAILPWSFLQAEYAQPIRVWLANNFGRIKVLALGADYFETALERVLLLWLDNHGNSSEEISFGYSYQIDQKVDYYPIDKKSWEAQSVMVTKGKDVEEILETYINEHGFNRLKDFAKVNIGIVTGADDFFIITKDKAKAIGLSNKFIIPIMRTSRELSALLINGKKTANSLLVIPEINCDEIRRYIRSGLNKHYNRRSHAMRREPWYHVNPGETPDAFFPYRCAHTPYLTQNNGKLQCTNSIHRVYFSKNLSENRRKWIQIALLSVPGQLSLEAYSRVYGEGVLKTEPSSLVNAIVHIGDKKLPKAVYQRVAELIKSNQKQKAVETATEFINTTLGIPAKLSDKATAALAELQNRRKRNTKLRGRH